MNEFKTSDIGLSAYLCSKSIPLVRVEPNGRRAWFVFGEGAEDTASAYWDDTAIVNPRIFQTMLRDLKSRIYNQQDGTNVR